MFSYFFYIAGDLNDTLAKKSLTRNNMEGDNRSSCNVDGLKPSEDQLTDLAKDIVGFWKLGIIVWRRGLSRPQRPQRDLDTTGLNRAELQGLLHASASAP